MTTEKDLRASLSMTTVSGRIVSVRDPRPADIDLGDIAHALSMQCRYAGHIRQRWSVASHSIACMLEAEQRGMSIEIQRACLMHDAAEAYVGDLIWPVKAAVREGASHGMFDRLEARFAIAIALRFGLPIGFDGLPEVHAIDQAVCAREMLDLRSMPVGWRPHVEPADPRMIKVAHGSEERIRALFLDYTGMVGIRPVSSAPADDARRGGA